MQILTRYSSGCALMIFMAVAGCGKSKADEVLAKMEGFKNDACACKDEACVDKVEQAVRDYQKATLDSLKDEKASDAQMKKLVEISKTMDTCASKYQLDAGTKFVLEGLKKDVVEVKDKVSKGEVSSMDCVGISLAVDDERLVKGGETRPDVAELIKEGAKLCKEDIPLMVLEKETKKAEDARAKDAKGVLSECFSANFSLALEEANKTPAAADKAKSIEARFLAACPKS